ncbi:ArsR family transcriptional regulator [Natronolimnohabitans sp. A-GB9]|uniref:winged helix-turn-helix transcriptional regulator n=1 Tax=Natronolimnohabitans sp. A-GB9 TaxID=3069757 RepID=UPI0027B7060C|nr:helix-turn-helix domain-containing protein [Natronolimnohabitans sp. A-GB9]MDQ2049441.1 ArsR family transcriptional regulator [Natronolimnohabitans sp. A-GB9]
MSNTRDQIRAHVQSNAGIHFNELVRESEFAPGQIQYHIRRLIDAGDLVREECYGQTHYYPPQYDEWERAALALFRRETVREIVVHLIEHEPCRPGTVADDLGIARSTLEYHLDHLVEHDIVTKEYDRRNRVTLSLSDPDRTAPLLSEVTPTVPDRLVDRFTRLVDGLLEGTQDTR